jgi:anti-sigma B factor antagonist
MAQFANPVFTFCRSQPLKIDTQIQDRIVIVQIEGRLTMQNSHELLEVIKKHLNSNIDRILVHLAALDYMDSSGIGVLITGLKSAKAKQIELDLVQPGSRVKGLMEMSGLESVFKVFPSMDAALNGSD